MNPSQMIRRPPPPGRDTLSRIRVEGLSEKANQLALAITHEATERVPGRDLDHVNELCEMAKKIRHMRDRLRHMAEEKGTA